MATDAPPPGVLITDASQRRVSRSESDSSLHKGPVADPIDKEQQILAHEIAKDEEEVAHDRQRRHELYAKFRPYILALTAAVILGWWISSTVLEKTRHRWFVLSPQSILCNLILIVVKCPC